MIVLKHWFSTHLRSVLAWTVVIFAVCLMYTSMFAIVADMKDDLLATMPK